MPEAAEILSVMLYRQVYTKIENLFFVVNRRLSVLALVGIKIFSIWLS